MDLISTKLFTTSIGVGFANPRQHGLAFGESPPIRSSPCPSGLSCGLGSVWLRSLLLSLIFWIVVIKCSIYKISLNFSKQDFKISCNQIFITHLHFYKKKEREEEIQIWIVITQCKGKNIGRKRKQKEEYKWILWNIIVTI